MVVAPSGGGLSVALLAAVPFVVGLGALGSVVNGLDVGRWGWLLLLRLCDRVNSLTEGYVEFIRFGGQFGELEFGLVDEVVPDFLRQLTQENCAREEIGFVLLWVEGEDLLKEVGRAEVSESG